MLCAVHLLNGTIENIALHKHAKGLELLEQVCHRSKLLPEMDYFGLKFFNKLGQEQWLNLRNEIRSQMSKSQIYQLHFRVKYFVKQSQLFLEETKHQFFLNIKQNLSEGNCILSRDKRSRYAALSLRSDHGEYALDEIGKYPLILREWNPQVDIEALEKLKSEHARLKGISGLEAEKVLVSEMEREEQTYGSQLFSALNHLKDKVIIAVCVDAVRIYDNDHVLIDEYQYATGLYTSVKGSHFVVEIEENYRCFKITYKLNSPTEAKNLYRTTVEFCTFFTQEKVYDWVLDSKRTITGLKTLRAFLKKRNRNGPKKQKIYDFDLTRTAQETFSKAWRMIAEERAKSIQIACGLNTPKLQEQKSFKFGPDTPKPSNSKPFFDFPRPASRLRSRSGYLTPTTFEGLFHSSLADTPKSPRTEGIPLTPGGHLTQTITLTPITPVSQGMSLTPGFSFTAEMSLKSFTSEVDQHGSPSKQSTNADQSIQDIVMKLKESSSAQKEKKAFQARFLCKVCKKSYRNCSFVPCGHVVVCVECALSCDKCSECQADVENATPVRYP